MINKKSLWFLTLFSLILVLSVYYVTMPSELLLNNNSDYTKNESEKEEVPKENSDEVTVKVEESELLVSLRVEADEVMNEELKKLQEVLTNAEATVDEKNQAYDRMKNLNNNRGEEEKIESLIKEKHQLQAFVKIDGDQVKIVVNGSDHNIELANNIMRTVQTNFKNKMYISVKFQK